MTGPYDYVPPNYWLTDTKLGGAWGFNTETSPGPAIPPPASLRKFLPPDKLWPQNETWGLHEGGEHFQTITFYNTSMEHRYGAPKDLNDFVRKAYAMDYEGERAMFEAYARNKFNSTGVIQWMLNNGWPSLIWHLYDYYLAPAGGYYGTKKANEPMHVLYSYDSRSVAVVSDLARTIRRQGDCRTLQHGWHREVDAGRHGRCFPRQPLWRSPFRSCLTCPPLIFSSSTATDRFGKVASDNFYWLSTKPDEMAWDKTARNREHAAERLRGHDRTARSRSGLAAGADQACRFGLRDALRGASRSAAADETRSVARM